MTTECSYEGCTFDTTGICLLGREPPDCPNIRPESDEPTSEPNESFVVADETNDSLSVDDLASTSSITAPELQSPVSTRSALPVGRQLKYPDLERIASDRGFQLIGILGPPEAGKTAVLVSLYLLLSSRKLERFEFRNSDSLFALDELARGAREWDDKGDRLQAITDRTNLEDPRRPGFLHLRLYAAKLGRPVDFVFPDLPGEWTNGLISSGDHERLAFLGAAQVLWVFVDGSALIDPVRRQSAADRTKKVLSRIRQFVADAVEKPIKIVITRHDEVGELPQDQLDLIQHEANVRGLSIEFMPVACISDRADMPSGSGIEDLLDASIILPRSGVIPPADEDDGEPSRQMLKYRSQV